MFNKSPCNRRLYRKRNKNCLEYYREERKGWLARPRTQLAVEVFIYYNVDNFHDFELEYTR